jgi:hypothetical protein
MRLLMGADPRGERLQIMLTKEELTSVDTWRFGRRMPSRAAAVRELLRRGLSAEGFAFSDGATKSGGYGVIVGETQKAPRGGKGAAVNSDNPTVRNGRG